MKYLLIIFIFITAISISGQAKKEVTQLSFASKEFKVPEGCKAQSQYQVQCTDYTMLWLYMNDEMLKTMPDQAVNQLSSQLKDFKKKAITAYLLGEEVKAYKISFKNENTGKTGYQIVAYGVTNGQPVLVQLSLNKEPKADDDLPEFPKQIIRLSK
jgi:hypothetical protein